MSLELQMRRSSALCGMVGCLTACGSNPVLALHDGDRTMDAGTGMEQDGKSPATPDAAMAADDGLGPSAPDARTVDDPVDGGADTVIGTVLDFETHRALPRRIVKIAGVSALTDDAGRFRIPHAPAVYDALIVDPDR
jgi:hypothetical protein